MKRELVALLLLSYGCRVTVYVLWLFLTMPWIGLQCVIVVFPDHPLFQGIHLNDSAKMFFFVFPKFHFLHSSLIMI